MFKELLKKLAGIRQKVQIGSQFDKRNVADEVRGVKANQAMLRYKMKFDQALGSQNDLLESDLNQQASLIVDGLTFIAKAKNAFGNLITISIIDDGIVSAAVDEEQLIDFGTVPDAGLWSVSFGSESTSDLAFNANAAAVQAALRLIEGLEDVTVAGDYTLGFTVTFAGGAGGADQPLLVEDTNTLTTVAVPVVITITEEVVGEAAVDTTGCIVTKNDIKIHCESGASNEDIQDLVEASAPASALVSVEVESGEEATAATIVENQPLTGGA